MHTTILNLRSTKGQGGRYHRPSYYYELDHISRRQFRRLGRDGRSRCASLLPLCPGHQCRERVPRLWQPGQDPTSLRLLQSLRYQTRKWLGLLSPPWGWALGVIPDIWRPFYVCSIDSQSESIPPLHILYFILYFITLRFTWYYVV